MRRFISRILLIGFAIIIQAAICLPQDSSKIIILSSKVGISIDSDERDYYKLFQNYDGFVDAIIYEDIDSLFYCKITYSSAEAVKDTTFKVSYGLMLNWAGRIEYFEYLKKGGYQIDPASITLRYSNGMQVKKPGQMKYEKPASGYHYYKEIPLNKTPIDNKILIKDDFQLGVSIGMAHNSATFDGLNNIFNLLEENIPEDPYVVPKSDLTFNANPLVSVGIVGLFKYMIMGELEYSFTLNPQSNSKLKYDSFIMSISYLLQFSQIVFPYITAGYMGYNFEVVNNYNVIVNDRRGTLTSITLNGNAKGPVFGIGIIFNVAPAIGINLFGKYKYLGNPKVKTGQDYNPNFDPADFETNVDASSYEIGVKIIFK